MPIEWFTRLLVAVRSLTAVQRGQVDERVAVWELASIPAESFRTVPRRGTARRIRWIIPAG